MPIIFRKGLINSYIPGKSKPIVVVSLDKHIEEQSKVPYAGGKIKDELQQNTIGKGIIVKALHTDLKGGSFMHGVSVASNKKRNNISFIA